MIHVPTLAGRQQAFAAWLLQGDPARAPAIASSPPASPALRLRLYAEGYRWRLVEVLGNDFPVLRAALGDARFERAAEAYLQAHPSRHPSVRHLGARFPRWWAARDPVSADLARLEWAQGEVFDAADAPAVTLDDVASIPAEAWAGLRLALHPALRRLRLRSNATSVLDAHARGEPLPALHLQPASTWLLWREAFDVHWRRLPRDEATALAAVSRGDAFADWCARLPGPAPALRAAGLLKRWLADGLVTGLSFPS